MSRPDPWKLATLAFACTTVLLGAVLLAHPQASEATKEPLASSGDESATAAGQTDSRSRRRIHLPPEPASGDESSSSSPAPASPATFEIQPPWKAALAEDRDIGAILADHVFDREGATPVRAPFDALIARLREDEDRAVAVLEDWIRRRYEIGRAGSRLTSFPPVLFSAYAELRGKAAIPLLRSLVPDPTDLGAWTVIAPLIRAGDPEVSRRVDTKQRTATGDDFQDPGQIAVNGTNGVALVRAWAETAANPALRESSRKALWALGTAEDRDRLWASAADAERFGNFYVGPGHAWWDRLRARAIEALDADDPWQRVLAARWMLLHIGSPGIDADRVAEIAASDAQGPRPPGRDPARWDAMVSKLRKYVQRRREHEAAQRRLREVLGLE